VENAKELFFQKKLDGERLPNGFFVERCPTDNAVFGVATTEKEDVWRIFMKIGFVDALSCRSIASLSPS